MGLGKWLPFGRVPEIEPRELHRAVREREVQVVDVRTTVEYRRSRIPSAQHLPITSFGADAVEALGLEEDTLVVAICLTAHRSIPAVRQLRDLGYEAKHLRGGMKAWWREGLPCEGEEHGEGG